MVSLGNWSAGVPVTAPLTAWVSRYLKWFLAPAVVSAMLWQVEQAVLCSPGFEWRPVASLYWGLVVEPVRTWWQEVQVAALVPLRVPVCQLGVVFPPWQLTFEQVSVPAAKAAAPDWALKVVPKATGAGAVG